MNISMVMMVGLDLDVRKQEGSCLLGLMSN